MGLYSEPVYSYPQPQHQLPPPPNFAPPPLPRATLQSNIYGTLPRRPPRPIEQGSRPSILGKDKREMLLNARRLGHYATYRRRNSNDSSRTLPNFTTPQPAPTRQTKVRWSQEDLLLETPPGKRKLLTSYANRQDSEEDETTLAEDTSSSSGASSEEASSIFQMSEKSRLVKSNHVDAVPAPPVLPPRRPPRLSDQKSKRPPSPMPYENEDDELPSVAIKTSSSNPALPPRPQRLPEPSKPPSKRP